MDTSRDTNKPSSNLRGRRKSLSLVIPSYLFGVLEGAGASPEPLLVPVSVEIGSFFISFSSAAVSVDDIMTNELELLFRTEPSKIRKTD